MLHIPPDQWYIEKYGIDEHINALQTNKERGVTEPYNTILIVLQEYFVLYKLRPERIEILFIFLRITAKLPFQHF